MDNSINDFTINHYEEILKEALKRFQIKTVGQEFDSSNKTLILRHDVDLSPEAAYKIALVENELGVTSSYFILLHSPFYNAFDIENINYFKAIHELGHEIGLHFDSHFFGTQSIRELERQLSFEKQILESYLEIDIKSFSFHLTNEFTKSCKNESYAGMKNAFSQFFQNDKVYCSDSFGVWRFKRLMDYVVKTDEPLIQVLTHPEWWVFDPLDTRKRVLKHIELIQKKLIVEGEKNYILN